MADKTHKTALVIIPPEEVWEPIQEIRREHDKQVKRWMPHITLLYPFFPKPKFTEAAGLLAPVGWDIAPFEVTLKTFDTFQHGKGSFSVWLRPEPEKAVVNLQTKLWEAAPAYSETRSFGGGFTPHLSVGQVQGRGARNALLKRLQADWEPLSFRVEAVSFISRKAPPNDTFQVDRRIVLEG